MFNIRGNIAVVLAELRHAVDVADMTVDGVRYKEQVSLCGLYHVLQQVILKNIITGITDNQAHSQNTGQSDKQYSFLDVAERTQPFHECLPVLPLPRHACSVASFCIILSNCKEKQFFSDTHKKIAFPLKKIHIL